MSIKPDDLLRKSSAPQKNDLCLTPVKPAVVVSRCLEHHPCRYNGQVVRSQVVRNMINHVAFEAVCPEIEIGLGVPRNALHLERNGEDLKLLDSGTGEDFGERMRNFSKAFVRHLKNIDGLILKRGSPSCGVSGVAVHQKRHGPQIEKGGSGLFAEVIITSFPQIAIEDDGRLRNFRLREHFLTKLYALARFRQVKESSSVEQLRFFHNTNKFLLLAYPKTEFLSLAKALSACATSSFGDVCAAYELHLGRALANPPQQDSYLSVLMHIFGHISSRLSNSEESYFIHSLEEYSAKKIPLSAVVNILKAWIIRFDLDYLKHQTIFEPYPEDMVEISDSGKGRDF